MVQSDLEVPVVGYTEVLLYSSLIRMALIKEKKPYNFCDKNLLSC